MKNKYCSQCGTELKGKIFICPNCGYKNNKRRGPGLLKIIIPVIILILIGAVFVYLYRNNSISNAVFDIFNGFQDPDYNAKRDYKETYESFILDMKLIQTSRLFSVDKVAEATDFPEVVAERTSAIEGLKANNCFKELQASPLCSSLFGKFEGSNGRIHWEINNFSLDSGSCLYWSKRDFDQVLKECGTTIANKAVYYSIERCSGCNDNKLQQLITLGAKIKDPNLAQTLVGLVDGLRNYDSLMQSTLKARRNFNNENMELEVYEFLVLILKNKNFDTVKDDFKAGGKYYDNYMRFVDLGGKAFTKDNLTSSINNKIAALKKYNDYGPYEGFAQEAELKTITQQLKDTVSVINGVSGMNLSLPADPEAD